MHKSATPLLRKGVTGAEEVDTHLGAEEVHTLLCHDRFLIRGFMHEAATSTLCLSQHDHIALRTVPPSYSCRPDQKSLIFATEQKFSNFFLKLPHGLNKMRQSFEIFEIFEILGFWCEIPNITLIGLEYIVTHTSLDFSPPKKISPPGGNRIKSI